MQQHQKQDKSPSVPLQSPSDNKEGQSLNFDKSPEQVKQEQLRAHSDDRFMRAESMEIAKPGDYEGPIGLTRHSIQMKMQYMDPNNLALNSAQFQNLQNKVLDDPGT